MALVLPNSWHEVNDEGTALVIESVGSDDRRAQ